MTEQYCLEHARDLAKAVEHAACSGFGLSADFKRLLEVESLYSADETQLENLRR
jgi:hypothetical protein